MEKDNLRILTAFDEPTPARSSPLSRSPLSAIAAPNEVKPYKKSFRQVAFDRRQKLAGRTSLHADSCNSLTPNRRRAVKVWDSPKQADRLRRGENDMDGTERPQIKWVRGEAIGRGTHGRVYLGLNVATAEMIAVKQITFPKVAASPEHLGRPSALTMKLEMENMKGLRHPNLVDYLGLEEASGVVSILMDYTPGRSLRQNILKYGKFGDETVKSFTSQILDALVYLHARGMIHGGLKSSNVLVDPRGTCKIEGLCCSESDIRDSSRSVPRAIFWTAPEIIRTQYKGYNAMADIWSIGCVVLEMCTGKRPWYGVEAVAVMFKLFHQALRPHPPTDLDVNPAAEDFIGKCLVLDSAARMAAVELKKHAYLVLPSDWLFEGFAPPSPPV